MYGISGILDTLMDEDVLYTLSIVAVSSLATIGAFLVGYEVLVRKKKEERLQTWAKWWASPWTWHLPWSPVNDGHGAAVKHSISKAKGDGVKSAGDDGASEDQDPFEYCEHIQGEVKKIRQHLTTKKIQEAMSQEQIEEERQAQRKQLEAIFTMMAEENDKFGIQSLDDIQTQMSLYV